MIKKSDVLCNKDCQWFATGQWFSPGALVSSTNKTDLHDITEILLKVVLNTINQPPHVKSFDEWIPISVDNIITQKWDILSSISEGVKVDKSIVI